MAAPIDAANAAPQQSSSASSTSSPVATTHPAGDNVRVAPSTPATTRAPGHARNEAQTAPPSESPTAAPAGTPSGTSAGRAFAVDPHTVQDSTAEDRHIAGEGTSEATWQAWGGLATLPSIDLSSLLGDARRLVIAAPHPDDEILGAGGLIAMTLAHTALPIRLLAVTDGGGSHPGSALWPVPKLCATRAGETAAALETIASRLGCASRIEVCRLGFADGSVTPEEDALTERLLDTLREGDLLVATWEHDGHPDHEALGRAARAAAQASKVRMLAMPVWTWHWAAAGDRRVPWQRAMRLDLTGPAESAKRAAAQCFASQLDEDISTGAAPILPPFVLARTLRSFEVYFE
ncbi:PIG-L deacetylase family protein [Chitinasiproducens palmae]|uniref:N-acetylglucosaminyl deacetylase, LmbE family n=1 Tax=Chitinasiproducens palmae TaxID=1770053 RepID=A0A1H2PQV3_9BURK|nr:PIG-L family deacetylase [Chitinasiproducens palmae]SDV48394.1 N-acetylglucosaminyl deacetylase, LmbE family [Chitinasiproducens palmae]